MKDYRVVLLEEIQRNDLCRATAGEGSLTPGGTDGPQSHC
jgi:hypothetical protein